MQQTEVYLKSLSAGREKRDKNSELQGPLPHNMVLKALDASGNLCNTGPQPPLISNPLVLPVFDGKEFAIINVGNFLEPDGSCQP
jgi:hypothetical protein